MNRLRNLALVFALLSTACSQSTAAREIHVTSPSYTLVLDGDWRELTSDDPEEKTFVSQSHNTRLVVSSLQMSPSQIEPQDAAQHLVQSRLSGERQAAERFGRQMTIAEPVIAPQPWGAMVAYYGHDNVGRQFNFAGMVTRRQILQTYVESPTLSADELFAVFQGVQKGLTFDESP